MSRNAAKRWQQRKVHIDLATNWTKSFKRKRAFETFASLVNVRDSCCILTKTILSITRKTNGTRPALKTIGVGLRGAGNIIETGIISACVKYFSFAECPFKLVTAVTADDTKRPWTISNKLREITFSVIFTLAHVYYHCEDRWRILWICSYKL